MVLTLTNAALIKELMSTERGSLIVMSIYIRHQTIASAPINQYRAIGSLAKYHRRRLTGRGRALGHCTIGQIYISRRVLADD